MARWLTTSTPTLQASNRRANTPVTPAARGHSLTPSEGLSPGKHYGGSGLLCLAPASSAPRERLQLPAKGKVVVHPIPLCPSERLSHDLDVPLHDQSPVDLSLHVELQPAQFLLCHNSGRLRCLHFRSYPFGVRPKRRWRLREPVPHCGHIGQQLPPLGELSLCVCQQSPDSAGRHADSVRERADAAGRMSACMSAVIVSDTGPEYSISGVRQPAVERRMGCAVK